MPDVQEQGDGMYDTQELATCLLVALLVAPSEVFMLHALDLAQV